MVRMRNLLRRLHLGGGSGGATNRRPTAAAPLIPPAPPPPSASDGGSGLGVRVSESPSSSTSSPSPSTRGRSRSEGVAPGDFSLFEEEYQVQLALAISVSDPDGREDPESAQINAAKKMSLGCTPVGPTGRDGLADALSQRYWTYNVLNYNEKVIDGFYDVYGIIADHNPRGTIPLLVDLKAAPISDNIDHEVVLVNRADDEALQQLESQAVTISSQCKVAEYGPVASGLIQMISDLVVDRMGGPVDDADDMLRRWSLKSYELRATLNSIVLPLGCLIVGLSRHRALLFKVLADRIDLPCRLVKGSCYTGIDGGAVILIKADDEREFIIDLMGAPGALIPAEMPTCYFQNAPIDVVNSSGITQNVKELSLALGSATNWQFDGQKEPPHRNSVGSSTQKESIASSKENDSVAHGRKHIDTLPCDINKSRDNEAESSFREIKAKTVPEYIASAAKNPDFAQKLHAILKESGLSPPSDLLTDLNFSHSIRDQKAINQEVQEEQLRQNLRDDLNLDMDIYPAVITRKKGGVYFDNDMSEMNYLKDPDSSCGAVRVSCGDKQHCPVYSGSAEGMDPMPDNFMQTSYLDSEDNSGIEGMKVDLYKQEPQRGYEDSTLGHKGTADNNTAASNQVLDDVAEWEIPWEDLQLGERIGLGSYGEVYHADWNGTEVAVKKFLDQGLSGDSLEQFRAEVKIMLRLRHPNVVLFMGAVTRPPNLSILTEYLPRGSLFRLLHRPNPQIDERQRLRMALDVAKGMNYLHTSHPPIVHRDLKSSNLLVDNSWVVKVCDFGLSRLKHHTFLSSKSTAGTPEWMAPEVLRNERSNEKCDVYSFGVILWELATLRTPWSGMNPMQVVGAVGFQNRHLDIPNEVDPIVAEIIHNCWHSEPDKRPSFAQLLGPLKRLQRLVVQSD